MAASTTAGRFWAISPMIHRGSVAACSRSSRCRYSMVIQRGFAMSRRPNNILYSSRPSTTIGSQPGVVTQQQQELLTSRPSVLRGSRNRHNEALWFQMTRWSTSGSSTGSDANTNGAASSMTAVDNSMATGQTVVTSGSEEKGGTTTAADEKDYVVLFKKNPGRLWFPRSVLVGTSLHSVYWWWYVFDFTPAVNSSPMTSIHVLPEMGYVGLIMATLMSVGACLYPPTLVDEIRLLTKQTTTTTDATTNHADGAVVGSLAVTTHTLPWVRPADQATASQVVIHPWGTLVVDNAADIDTILKQGSISHFRGHLGLQIKSSDDSMKKKWQPNHLLLEIRLDDEVKDADLLLQALLKGSPKPMIATTAVQPGRHRGRRAKDAQRKKQLERKLLKRRQ